MAPERTNPSRAVVVALSRWLWFGRGVTMTVLAVLCGCAAHSSGLTHCGAETDPGAPSAGWGTLEGRVLRLDWSEARTKGELLIPAVTATGDTVVFFMALVRSPNLSAHGQHVTARQQIAVHLAPGDSILASGPVHARLEGRILLLQIELLRLVSREPR